ncbi:TPA: hypothetical protein SMR42_005154 [Pseudomonas putida]|nr:hypothetical protein [Pseudomonas putida]HEK1688739.1 hypothetical protein [Pseudomonas putida]
MSLELIDLAKLAAKNEISGADFEIKFFEAWHVEGESGELAKDAKEVSDCLYVVFDLAERYTSSTDRKSYELDEESLRVELEKTLRAHGFM